ncbi:hypothetical protein MRX96_009241 [Rhipicephalus microplus]
MFFGRTYILRASQQGTAGVLMTPVSVLAAGFISSGGNGRPHRTGLASPPSLVAETRKKAMDKESSTTLVGHSEESKQAGRGAIVRDHEMATPKMAMPVAEVALPTVKN